MALSSVQIAEFRKIIYCYYNRNKRTFPWRDTTDPYCIFVSEIMLQQTQTDRVVVKYKEFISAFPDIATLATAKLSEILKIWQGLGYNRRAIALHKAADQVLNKYSGKMPKDPEALITLPGVGKATAGSIAAFAFNKPTLFIETNIRTVYIYFFFENDFEIDDSEILPVLEETLDRKKPRQWYSALMDYGAHLKKSSGNAGKRSKHYQKQSPFDGSDRQVRGNIIKTLLKESRLSTLQLATKLGEDPSRVERIINDLQREGFIQQLKGKYQLL